MFKANDFDRDAWGTFIVQILCQKMKTFCLLKSFQKKIAFSQTLMWIILYCFPVQAQTIFLTGFTLCIDNITYLLQSLDKQSLLCNFYISALVFSQLQIQHKASFLQVLIPTKTIFPTCFNPKIGNLRYLYKFSSLSFCSSEDQFQVAT